jgi:amino acid permease
MSLLGTMGASSPFFWIVLAACAIAFALVVTTVGDRENSRFYLASVVVYVAAWALMFGFLFHTTLLRGVPVGPPWPVSDFPTALLIGAPVVFVGGHVLAGVFRVRHALAHPLQWKHNRPPKTTKETLTEAELEAAEDYDAKWQAEDRERNRKLRSHGRM